MTSQLPSEISDDSHPSSDLERDQDMWIQLYDQLLWVTANLRIRPVVFQNNNEAHEQFLAYFGISTDVVGSLNGNEGPLSLKDKVKNMEARCRSLKVFSARRERLMTGMRWRLQEIMRLRLQRGGHLEVRGLIIEPRMLEEYKEICHDVGIGKDASYPEDYHELWLFLQEIVLERFQPALCSRFKFNGSRTVQVQCTAEKDSGGRCERTDIKTVSELLEDDSWRTCGLHSGEAVPTSLSRSLIVAVVDEQGETRPEAVTENVGELEEPQ